MVAFCSNRWRRIHERLLPYAALCILAGLVLPALNIRGGIDGDLNSAAIVLLAFGVGFAQSSARTQSGWKRNAAIMELLVGIAAAILVGWILWRG